MDKLTIFLPDARQIKRLAMTLALLLTAGCATTDQDTGARDADGDASEVELHLAAAERLAGIGEYESALEEYLAAARGSADPEVARMVTRLAGRLQYWETAVAAAERWIELEPDNQNARGVRIVALVNLDRIDEAISALRERMRAEETAQDAWTRAALLLSAAVGDDQARTVFGRLVDEAGGSAPPGVVDHARSLLLWRSDLDDEALDHALDAAAASGRQDHRVWAAQLSTEGGRLEQALELYRTAREDDPDAQSLALAEAEVLRRLDRDEAALEVLRSVPPDRDVLYTLGVYLVELGREDEAIGAWERLADLAPDDDGDEHAFLVAQLAEVVNLEQAALEWYRRVEDGPRREQSILRRAVLQADRGDLAVARGLLERLRAEADGNMTVRTWLLESQLLREAGRPERAAEVLGGPLADNPGSVDLLYARALAAANAGNVRLAEQDLRRIIQMEPDNAIALNALGYTLADQTDRLQEAYRLIQRALELDPDDPATLDSMGWVLFKLGQPREAIGYLERALESDNDPEILAHVIEVEQALGRERSARERARRAREAFPDHRYLRSTLERLNLP